MADVTGRVDVTDITDEIVSLKDLNTVQTRLHLEGMDPEVVRDLHVTPIVGGWRVRSTAHWHLDVMQMAYGNLRIVETFRDNEWGYDRGWCYHASLLECVLRCGSFDPEDRTAEPEGWVKQVGTERRACGCYLRGPRLHPGYVADCVYCGDESLA